MTVWICVACGVEHANTARPPARCAICSDERQYVPAAGQDWTSQQQLAGKHTGSFEELEPGLHALRVTPSFGIGQRGLLLCTPAGNVLWEPPGYLDQSLIDAATALGGVTAISASHPHLVGCSITWSRAMDGVPVYVAEADRRWIRRPDEVIRLWSGRQELLPGVELVQCGGHFAGSAVLHWRSGADGRGVLLVGDTLMVGADRASVSFLRSYPNMIPLPERSVRRITDAVAPLAYDRLYGAFHGSAIATDGQAAVRRSAERYIGWVTDRIRDPDESV